MKRLFEYEAVSSGLHELQLAKWGLFFVQSGQACARPAVYQGSLESQRARKLSLMALVGFGAYNLNY